MASNEMVAPICRAENRPVSPKCAVVISELPKEGGWIRKDCYYFRGSWLHADSIFACLAFNDHFQDRHDDVILATAPKSGTTWLKALAFAVVHRARYSDFSNHPLISTHSQELVKTLDLELYARGQIPDDLGDLPSPRLFGTHWSFPLLRKTIKCKIVFLCRNPGDNLISMWKFANKLLSMDKRGIQISLEEAFEMYCNGRSAYGPYWDTVLGYWEASKEEPERVLFLKYEELSEDPYPHVKRLAQFLGVSFTEEEERKGVVEEVIKLCSFESLSNLEVSKTGILPNGYPSQSFFRCGRVGDWATYLTNEMVERLNCVTNEKMRDSGLDLTLSL